MYVEIDHCSKFCCFKLSQKKSISNKCCSFEFSIHQIILKKASQLLQNYKAAHLFLTNIYWAQNQHIIINSEGSCDTATTGKNYILNFKTLNKITIHNISAFTVFLINTALMSNSQKSTLPFKLLNCIVYICEIFLKLNHKNKNIQNFLIFWWKTTEMETVLCCTCLSE